jgi:phage protein D
MVKKPSFRLTAEGKDITPVIAKNLISLTYDDKSNDESDEISFTVNGLFAKKPFGSQLELWLGYGGALYKCGSYTVQTIEKDYVAQTTEVRATAANFASSQKENKSITWEKTNLEDMARKIAAQNNLTLKVYDDAKSVLIKSELQKEMTDLRFLYMIASKNGFLGMDKNGTLYIHKHNNLEATADKSEANGSVYAFKLQELNSLSITEANRDVYTAVTLEWQDSTENKIKILKVGTGDTQVYKTTIPEPKSEAEAVRYAEAKLRELRRGGITGRLEMAGREIKTGAAITIDAIDAEFNVTSVSHSLDSSGYNITLDFEG